MGRPRVPNPWTLDGDSAWSTVTRRGGAGHRIVVDAADLDVVRGHRWSLRGGYASTHVPTSAGRYRRQSLHALLVRPPVGCEVDHRDGDRLNNRRSNLRLLTHAENTANVFRPGREHVRGAYPTRGGKTFQARVVLMGKAHHLGSFATREEAADAARAFRLLHMPTSNEERGLRPQED